MIVASALRARDHGAMTKLGLAAVLLALPLSACGGSAPPAKSGGDAPSTETTHASAAGKCTATTSEKVPAGWVQVGSLVVNVAAGKPSTLDVKDASGKVLGTETLPAAKKDAREPIRLAVCKTGGVIGVVQGGKPAPDATSVTLLTYKPAKEDEAGDVALLCTMPGDIPPDFDESQRMRVAAMIYEERLTSPRWRTWLTGMGAELRDAAEADATTIKRKHGTELQGAAKGACWFATQLSR